MFWGNRRQACVSAMGQPEDTEGLEHGPGHRESDT